MATTVSWPDKLPLPTFENYGIEPQDGVLRTEMEAGPARQRRRYTQTPTRIPVRWRFTQWEFGIFEAWYKWKGKEGATWFSMDLLGGLGIVAHEARFVGSGNSPYKANPQRGGPGQGSRWIVTTTLEIRERPVLTEPALNIVLAEDVTGLFAAITSLHATVHTTMPGSAW
ncbi:conserved protein of unknown function [Magnetospirillum sp. XM-1]|uniref:hypothetical protein n=1 Tax=Magnetospirillum sp. XM-1 TaxID=1663591 RepID=UPI00073DCC6C|nr:hypothetical protein [Magnetospirillum sp. XM-1]CUW39670.1 conserved protein of unknown function [Magnetospirillum sp. XM-1]